MKVFNWILCVGWACLAVSAFAGWLDPSPVGFGMAALCVAFDCFSDATKE